MTVGKKVIAYKYNKNDELLRTDTLNTDTEEDTVVLYKNDRNGNQLATVNRYEIPEEKKGKPYIVQMDQQKINRDKNEYLYGVVAELGPEDNKLGEVSIYAAWKMTHQLKSKPSIGNDGQEGNWQIILYKTSAPKANVKHGGWKYKPAKLNTQLKKQGKKFYKKGRCLN